jgi:hypothetical protein
MAPAQIGFNSFFDHLAREANRTTFEITEAITVHLAVSRLAIVSGTRREPGTVRSLLSQT